jgi:hypothetical protein
MVYTIIQVDKKTARFLKSKSISSRETYDEIINRLIKGVVE